MSMDVKITYANGTEKLFAAAEAEAAIAELCDYMVAGITIDNVMLIEEW